MDKFKAMLYHTYGKVYYEGSNDSVKAKESFELAKTFC